MSCGGDTTAAGLGPEVKAQATSEPCDSIPAPSAEQSGTHLDNLTCAICLDQIAPCDIASIPQCEHQYCVNCILFWATHKEKTAWCPQCRVSFSQLRVYRHLDGTPRDLPDLESVCLLKRTHWFQDYARAREQGLTPGSATLLSGDSEAVGPIAGEDLQEELAYQRYWEDYDEDDEVEAYYHSAAAGHARITLGNRRWGENGYVASGRLRARPVPNKPKGPTPSKAQKAKGKGPKSGEGASSSIPGPSGSRDSPASASPSGRTPTGSQGGGRTPGASSSQASAARPVPSRTPQRSKQPACPIPGADEDDLMGTSPGGRRARRNARRAAQDEAAGLGFC